jgi:hypothetical protein
LPEQYPEPKPNRNQQGKPVPLAFQRPLNRIQPATIRRLTRKRKLRKEAAGDGALGHVVCALPILLLQGLPTDNPKDNCRKQPMAGIGVSDIFSPASPAKF